MKVPKTNTKSKSVPPAAREGNAETLTVHDRAARLEKLKGRFERFMERHHRLRFDMFVILGASFLSGILVSYLLLLLQFTAVLVRYPLAVFVSYLVFLSSIRLWLLYVSPSGKRGRLRKDGCDTGYSSIDPGIVGGSPEPAPLTGGSGEFGGAGVSGSFDVISGGANEGASGNTAIFAVSGAADGGSASTGGALEGLGDSLGDAGDGDSSIGVLIVVIVAMGLIVAIFGSIGYLIWHGSSLLCQAAFQSLLAANLSRRTRTIVHPEWCGSVIRMTWKPFGSILILVVLLAGLIQIYFPDATKLSDVVHQSTHNGAFTSHEKTHKGEGLLGKPEYPLKERERPGIEPMTAKVGTKPGNEEKLAEPTRALSANEWLERGHGLTRSGAFKEATEAYTKALEANPLSASAYVNRAFAYSRLGDWEHALKDSEEAVRLDPNKALAYINRGNAHGRLGDYEQMLRDSDKAIKLDPAMALAYNNRGWAYRNLGDIRSAIRDYERAISLDAGMALAYVNLGEARMKLGDPEHALEAYKAAARLNNRRAQDFLRTRGITW